MSFEITGRIVEIFETQQVTDNFKKREFILEIKESNNSGFDFIEYIKFQAVQDKCALLDQVSLHDTVKVSFNLRGRKWEKDGRTSYFTNLDAWRIEKEQSTNETPITSGDQDISAPPDMDAPMPGDPPPPPGDDFDGLPF